MSAGYSIQHTNYSRLLALAAYTDPDYDAQKGLASDLFNEMVNHGFKLVYQNGGGAVSDPTSMWNATQVVFEPKNTVDDAVNFVDPLGSTQPWRIGFMIQGSGNNELYAYLGTPSTMDASQGINTNMSYPVVLLEGGPNASDTRITATKQFGFRISITTRGVAFLVWNPKTIEDMTTMGLLCVQRPVKSDGTTLVDGFAPVFAVHNTDPMTAGRPSQSGRFFRTTVREVDVNIPSRTSNDLFESSRRATATITLRSLKDSSGQNFVVNLTINGTTVQFGTGPSGPPTSQNNQLVYIPTISYAGPDQLSSAASYLAAQLNSSVNVNIKQLTYVSSGPNVIAIANTPGVEGNNIVFSTSATSQNVILTPGATMGGGGGVSAGTSGTNYASGSVSFSGLPAGGDIIRFNGVDYKFVVGATAADTEISLGTLSAPLTLNAVITALSNKLGTSTSPSIQAASYSAVPGGNATGINIIYNTPGVEGNNYTLYTDSAAVSFTGVGQGVTTTLAGGQGFTDTADTLMYPDEISEPTGVLGSTMYRFPNVWNTPVTTDTGEYVLVFPFGFCTQKVAFTEEMDMIAVSKGAAYQGVQPVTITVYGADRVYTSYNSNLATTTTPDNYVRIFILTSGGDI